jgi:Spirocyclase AveC-like
LQPAPTTNALADTSRRRWAQPVTILAGLGLLFLAVQVVVFTSWALDDAAHPVPADRYPISPGRATLLWVLQAAVAAIAITVSVVAIHRCLRTRQVTFDAALILGYTLAFWQSPLASYTQLVVVSSPHALNMATWGPYLPGWDSPHPEQQHEGLFALSGLGYTTLILWVWLQAFLIGRITNRFPRWGWLRVLLAAFVAGIAVDLLIEGVWLSTGIYTYLTHIPGWTLFPGRWYGLPLPYAAVVSAFISTGPALMRHYESAHGATPFIFCGIHQYRPHTRAAVRLAAGVGAVNVLLLAYFAGLVVLAALAGTPNLAVIPGHLWQP